MICVSSSPVYVIAEAGVNHNGNPEIALKLVDAAAACGADAVKFQTFVPEALASASAGKAPYQTEATGGAGSQRAMLEKLALDLAAHRMLVERCRMRGIDFLSTPFDDASLRLLTDTLGLARIKIGSGDLTNSALLLAVARGGRDVILSTGMATLDEVAGALGVLAFGYGPASTATPNAAAFATALETAMADGALAKRVVLLHCTTAYPTPFEDVNLAAMDTLATRFGLPVGFSDHTPGIEAAVAAVARGARMIEKHLTLDRTLPGPDHRASLEPDEFRAMTAAIRNTEKALGDGDKRAMPSEAANMDAARKSLVAARAIRRGETFSAENLTVKRPGTGVSAQEYWDWIGRIADRDYAADEAISR